MGGAGVVIPTTPTSDVIGSITLQTDESVDLGIPPEEFDTSFDEFAVTLGLQYAVSDRLTFGAVYRSETKVEWEGEVNLTVGALGVNETVDFSLDLEMPAHLQLGLAYDVIPEKMIWSLDVQRTFWSDAKGLGDTAVIRLADPLLGFVNDIQLDYDASDAYTIRSGVEYMLDNRWTLYGGLAFDESVFGDSTVDILTYDSHRIFYSIGVGYDIRDEHGKGWKLHLGAQMIEYDDRTIESGESKNLGGVSLPRLTDADTLGFSANRDEFQFGGRITAFSFSFQYDF